MAACEGFLRTYAPISCPIIATFGSSVANDRPMIQITPGPQDTFTVDSFTPAPERNRGSWEVGLTGADGQKWIDIDHSISDVMEEHFNRFLHGDLAQPALFYARRSLDSGWMQWYQADFNDFTQTNVDTIKTRPIRRYMIDNSDPPGLRIEWQVQISPNAWRAIASSMAARMETAHGDEIPMLQITMGHGTQKLTNYLVDLEQKSISSTALPYRMRRIRRIQVLSP